ncbi:Cysteine-rich secretory protein family protein [Litoreibacter halocynthiae]|uniref:Cysteine-rich secretory protein family protein n=1 Tax=Litoreibacter halocynthiae TaxID=1242689 RepID=A0A4R7LMA0_9RHOB|nr:CAP domain-containing protein [Litoreibacter halocynthiae]TDT77123.1 Cysteine-rich secretory protein family protein [Litoreibacter halocynthiae]
MLRMFGTTAIAIAFLTACTPDDPVASSPAVATTVTSDANAVSRADVGALLNAERVKNGLPALSPNPKLAAAARAHAQDMSRSGFFDHIGSDKSAPSQRVRAQGYRYCYVAENIAQGWKTPEQVMQGWMDSPGHRRNNLSSKPSEYGAARAAGDYWVLVFGRAGC